MVSRFFWLTILMLFLTASSLRGCLPPIPQYPYQNSAEVVATAQQMSAELEDYIKAWMDGLVPAEIPENLLSQGMHPGVKKLYLQHYEEIVPSQQWMIRERQTINFDALHGYFPDPNCTYIKLGVFYAPFGSKLVIEGEFPHSRFFDIQASPSFDPMTYYYEKSFGAGEVPIADVDIDPLPGHINPFRVGSDRTSNNRSYKVTFDLTTGNAANLNRAFTPPYYRAEGNNRIAGAIQYQGPWGEDKKYGHGRGLWDTGDLWIRYYGIDKNKNAFGGVALPKAHYELSDGRRYFINADFSEYLALANQTIKARNTWPANPPKYWGKHIGWNKQFGIFLVIAEGISKVLNIDDTQYIRELDRGVTGRGEDQPPPGNYEPSTSTCTYINYLTRGISLGRNRIAVLTGKLPTFPKTRNGEATVETTQMRYWSIVGYDANADPDQTLPGAAVTSVMDDEVVLDSSRHYVIVYARAGERPVNANAESGVTWVNWGPTAAHTWTLRWLSVAPEWSMDIAPNEMNLPWSRTSLSGRAYDNKLIGENTHRGFLGDYLPRVHYMTTKEFEALGNSVTYSDIPVWK
ncbi:MAG: hypothetical protein F6K11_20120 [Leptolyngbya sp. SIO3F4]|nr:hypothetical protein [Leptolyngbya sp. SIO3F4]